MDRLNVCEEEGENVMKLKNFCIPGQKIYCGKKFLRGYGTRLIEKYDICKVDDEYDSLRDEHLAETIMTRKTNFEPESQFIMSLSHKTEELNNSIVSTVSGQATRFNRLICVNSMHGRYKGDVGDIVIGRIDSVSKKRWLVDIHSNMRAVLMLNSVNLPDGKVRRHCETDERIMRTYFKEGDLINAEVQGKLKFEDGSVLLNVRNRKYGKLGQGQLVKVPCHLIRHRKSHFYDFECQVSAIFGKNGYIWLYPTELKTNDCFTHKSTKINSTVYKKIALLRNIIIMFASTETPIFDDLIWLTYQYVHESYTPLTLLDKNVLKSIVQLCKDKYILD
ncbi:Ribosomal RNA-processing protein 4 [Intoshia linei]|uniref:Ribosomal RNA-processing protein 4 n=1 Tax=Intoshia linei TaxID=1819745 RepID=A0A177BC49_9BILA|nr:Ribosomal RNA-processing protein 4 [Intoshia linei]